MFSYAVLRLKIKVYKIVKNIVIHRVCDKIDRHIMERIKRNSMFYIANAVTETGNHKKVNQDSLTVKIADTKWGNVCMAVLCDGVGGLSCGEVASATVVLGFDQWFKEIFPYKDSIWTEAELRAAWMELVISLNQEIHEYGLEKQMDLGTTVTAVLLMDHSYYVIHVGDSRLYCVKDQVKQLTKDQSLVAFEVEQGRLTREEAEHDPRRNILLQSVGTGEQITPEWLSGKSIDNSTFLICSDGFRHEITEQEMLEMLQPERNRQADEIKKHLRELIDRDLQRGEKDNISAALIWMG